MFRWFSLTESTVRVDLVRKGLVSWSGILPGEFGGRTLGLGSWGFWTKGGWSNRLYNTGCVNKGKKDTNESMAGGIYELEIPWSQKNLSVFKWTLLGPCSILSARAESALPKFILVSWLCYSILGVNAPLASPLPRPTCFLKRRLFMGKGCSSGPQDRILYGLWRYGCLISPFTPGGNWVFRALASIFHFFFLKLFYFIYLFFIFDCAGSSLWSRLLSSCSKRGLLSSCSAWASHCSGFSCRAQTLGHGVSSVAVPGL